MDLNMMMRDAARTGLQTQMDAAVAEGNAEKVRKLADEIAKFDVAMAPAKPAGPPYGDKEIRAELGKLPWFGTDPVKSARAVELGKHMDPNKFTTAAAFADALVKAVEGKTAPAAGTGDADPDADPDADADADPDADPDADDTGKPVRKARKTDGPNDNDRGSGPNRRASSGPWTKMSDAPADIQKEIKRAEAKFVPAGATKEARETFISKALESHYGAHQRAKGKK